MTTDTIEQAPAAASAAALITAIRPEHIRIDGGTQARAGLDPATVTEYVEAMRDLCYVRNGLDRIPPIVVFHDGSAYWLADGFHRLEAYRQLQAEASPAPPAAIRAEVRQGTRRDAVLYAAGANADHGLRRTTADKERAVLAILQDEEWGQWSDREIARRCKVSHDFVRNVTERRNLTGRASSARKTADGRTMDTSNIAAANQARAERPEGDNPAPGDPRIDAMRGRFTALGYTQFYPSDKGYTAAHPVRGVAHYRAWANVEADIARKEANAPQLCARCGKDAGGAAGMVVDNKRYCAHCGGAVLQTTAATQAAQTAATRQACLIARTHMDLAAKSERPTIIVQHVRDARAAIDGHRGAEIEQVKTLIGRQEARLSAPGLSEPDAVRSSIAALEALGWGIDPDGAGYTLFKGLDAYATDADGVIAAARLAVERPDATPDQLMEAVNAIEDAAPALPPDFAAVAARFARLGDRLEQTGPDTFTLWLAGRTVGIGNSSWPNVLSRLEAQERLAAHRAAPLAAVIPADIAQAAHALALTVETRDDGRLLVFWPDESADDLVSQSAEQVRDWLTNEAPRIAIERAELLGWKAGTHKRAGQTLHAYHRAADGRETAEYADQALAAGEALRIAASDPAADPLSIARAGAIPNPPPCAVCGKPSAGKRNIGGELIERCQEHAARAEYDDLTAQLGAQYKGFDALPGQPVRHTIKWTGGTSGAYSYDDALAMYHSSAMRLRRFAAGTASPREAAAAWLGQISATLQRANKQTMFRMSEMQQAAEHVAALLAATPAPYAPLLEEAECGPVPTLADLDPLAPIAARLADVEAPVAAGLHGDRLAAELRACRRALDALAGDDTIPTEAYDDLSARIGDAQRALRAIESEVAT